MVKLLPILLPPSLSESFRHKIILTNGDVNRGTSRVSNDNYDHFGVLIVN